MAFQSDRKGEKIRSANSRHLPRARTDGPAGFPPPGLRISPSVAITIAAQVRRLQGSRVKFIRLHPSRSSVTTEVRHPNVDFISYVSGASAFQPSKMKVNEIPFRPW
jgi:hypothetical protein